MPEVKIVRRPAGPGRLELHWTCPACGKYLMLTTDPVKYGSDVMRIRNDPACAPDCSGPHHQGGEDD